MAGYGFVHKREGNELFQQFLKVIECEAVDEQLHVKMAVNRALRNTGKRHCDLHRTALESANRLMQFESKSVNWNGIFADASVPNHKGLPCVADNRATVG